MRPVVPPKPVQVERDGAWCLGQLEAWRRDDDGWRAYVRYTAGVGLRHLEWVATESVKPVTGASALPSRSPP